MEIELIKKLDGRVNRRFGTKLTERTRVAAYCRVSSDSEDQLNSYQSQVKYYEHKIDENAEWELVDIYADEAISGTQTNKRTDFMRMISDSLNGKIDLILTKSISRFARNTVDTLKYVRMLKEKNIAIIFEEENINTLEMAGELLLTILSSVAQQESETISSHVKLGLKMKKERGELIGFNRCLGYEYNADTKEMTIIESEAEIVRYIFDRYISGVGCQVLSRELKELDYKTIKGNNNWCTSTIIGIIKNEKYKGDILQGKTFTTDPITHKRLINKGEEDQYYIREHHKGIVSAEIFEKAQEILNKRNANRDTGRQKGNYSRKYPFSSRLYCGFCGQVMTRRNLYSNTPYSLRTWQCMNFVKLGKIHCPNCKTIKENIIEKCFVDMYNIMYKNNKNVLNNFLNEVVKTLKENTSEKEFNKFEMQKKELLMQNEKILTFLVDGVISKDEYVSKKQANINKIEKIEKEMKYLKDSMNAEDDIKKGLNKMKMLFENNEQLKEFDSSLFESLISRVIIGEEIDGVSYPYTITFLCKNNYENIGKPEIRIGNKPLIMEFISFQNFFSYEGTKEVNLQKKQNKEIRVKVRLDI